MRAKTLNTDASTFTRLRLSGFRQALIRLEHREGEGFDIREAYLYIEKDLPSGNLAEHFSAYKEIIDEWYNTEISAENGYSIFDDIAPSGIIRATGWAPLIGNYRYRDAFSEILAQIEKMETSRERRARIAAESN